MRQSINVLLATLTTAVLTATILPIGQTAPLLMQSPFDEQVYADCPPVNCSGGGSR